MRTKCDRLGPLAILAGVLCALNAALAPAQGISPTILRPTAAASVQVTSPTILLPTAVALAQSTSPTIPRPTASVVALVQDTSPTIFSPDTAGPYTEGLRFNFRGVSLDTVLDYLSKAAGFVIIRLATTDARLDVWSHQPLNNGEAINLLDTILNEKGLTAIRKDERTLLIIRREDARMRDLPLKVGSKPEDIPKTDQMVIQIIPIRYADANQLIDNIRLLLTPGATLSSNLSTNAIILIDTQTNIRRMVEIIRALDTSIADLSKLRVFPLKYADAVELARAVTDLFRARNTTQSGRSGFSGMTGGRSGMPGFSGLFGRGGFGSRGGSSDRGGSGGTGGSGGGTGGPSGSSGGTADAPTVVYSTGGVSEARQAQSLVVAVADERTNSLVVSAPEDLMPMIEKLVQDIDTMSEDLTEIRVFMLLYADAEETAKMITDVFENQTQRSRSSSSNQPSRFGGGPFGMFRPPGDSMGRGGPGGRGGSQGTQQSERKVQESTVQAVADTRTNSVVVRAASEVMTQIEEMIRRIDANPAKEKKVFVHSLNNADVEKVSAILEGMFGSQTTRGRSTQGTSTQNQNTRGSSSRTSNRNSQSRGTGSSGSGFGGGTGFGGGGVGGGGRGGGG